MKILWYVNIVMPKPSKHFGLKGSVGGGWLIGQAEALKQKSKLFILCLDPTIKEIKQTCIDDINYIIIPSRSDYLEMVELKIKQILPDIVHVFGTEYVFNTQIIGLCKMLELKYVVSLQGLMSECAKVYDESLPIKYKKTPWYIKTMKKLYYAQGIAIEKQEFYNQGKNEIVAIKQTNNIIGRTDWDKNLTLQINPIAKYFHVNENLREEFYTSEEWAYNNCKKHSVFISQAAYPIKGFHKFLEIMPKLIQRYPDLVVNVAGQSFYSLNNKFLDACIDVFFEYQSYIKTIIKKNNLQGNIKFLGPLSASEIKKCYLNSNVFVSCSSIENSPNSVGEAMILGVPIVASRVGGISSMLLDKSEGYLYDYNDTDKLFEYICEIFESRDNIAVVCKNAKQHAIKTHDIDINTQSLMKAYMEISEND